MILDKIDPEKTPDENFYKKILAQVQGEAYWGAFKKSFLQKPELLDIPFFLCGGGARMNYYNKLEKSLATRMPGYSYLKTELYKLAKPINLEAPGIDLDDYDRLSVAYGLSRLNINDIKDAIPKYNKSLQGESSDLDDFYIGPEQI